MMVGYAYQVQPHQISGESLPGVFDIEATMEGSPGDDQVRLMLQRLLAERFHLIIHREVKEVRAYELVVDKRGSKLTTTLDDRQMMLDGRPTPPGVGMYSSRSGPQMIGKTASMAQLAEALAGTLRGPVADHTGLAGTFDFNVHYAIESPDALQATAGEVTNAPTLIFAIREQLGIRVVEFGKGSIEDLVVDHVEKPSAN
jgi:uncharacterized protein (TIGR03435 family)